MKSTKDCLDKIKKFKLLLEQYDTVIVGAGSGLSTASGLDYSLNRFGKLFPDFISKYGYSHMYHAAFNEYESVEEHFAYWSRHIFYNRYDFVDNGLYNKIYELISKKDYFVVTTNADHLFQKNGFDKNRLFYMQGDYGLFQCSVPCHDATYDNAQIIQDMVNQQVDLKIPSNLIPTCKKCGAVMTTNLRKDHTFVEDDGWHIANERYNKFIENNNKSKVLFLEFGVGPNTPGIIKYPFWNLVYKNDNAFYITVGLEHSVVPSEIIDRSLSFDMDINEFMELL